jgi:hypothetical protein
MRAQIERPACSNSRGAKTRLINGFIVRITPTASCLAASAQGHDTHTNRVRNFVLQFAFRRAGRGAQQDAPKRESCYISAAGLLRATAITSGCHR